MKKKINLILLILTIISLISTTITAWWGLGLSADNDKAKNDYTLEVTKTQQFTDKNGILVTEKQNLLLTIDSLKSSKNDTIKQLLEELANSNIKTKNVENMMLMKSTTENTFKAKPYTLFLDSLRIDSVKVSVAKFHNSWIDFSYSKRSDRDSADVSIKTYHNIFVYISKYRDKWKLKNIFIWRKWKEKTTAKDLNPYSVINNLQTIEITK